VALKIGVSEASITLWENEKAKPQIKHSPKIYEFLGIFPFKQSGSAISNQIARYRLLNGLSFSGFGALIGVHATTVASWETGTKPEAGNLKILLKIFKKARKH